MGCATLSLADCDGAQLVMGMGTDEAGELMYHHTAERCITEYWPVSHPDAHKYDRWCRHHKIHRSDTTPPAASATADRHSLTYTVPPSAGFYVLSGHVISSASGFLHGAAARQALSDPATRVAFQAWKLCPTTDTFIPHYCQKDGLLPELRRLYCDWVDLFQPYFAAELHDVSSGTRVVSIANAS